MAAKPYDLKLRTQLFAVEMLQFVDSLPNKRSLNVIANQIARSASSVAANYRASKRAKSPKDFINKLKICEEECDETLFWLELLQAGGFYNSSKIKELITEANELTAIIVTAIKTARGGGKK